MVKASSAYRSTQLPPVFVSCQIYPNAPISLFTEQVISCARTRSSAGDQSCRRSRRGPWTIRCCDQKRFQA